MFPPPFIYFLLTVVAHFMFGLFYLFVFQLPTSFYWIKDILAVLTELINSAVFSPCFLSLFSLLCTQRRLTFACFLLQHIEYLKHYTNCNSVLNAIHLSLSHWFRFQFLHLISICDTLPSSPKSQKMFHRTPWGGQLQFFTLPLLFLSGCRERHLDLLDLSTLLHPPIKTMLNFI